jgi:hypothetical integral membrane protein (TIGR02206 family)
MLLSGDQSSTAGSAAMADGVLTFHAGSIVHLGVLAVVACAVIAMVIACRRWAGTPNQTKLLWALRLTWAVVWIIWEGRNLLPGRIAWRTSLPLHICSVVGIAIHIALWTRWRPARAIVTLIGIFVCSQALLTPPALPGPATAGFWVFFVSHGMIVVIAVYDVAANGFRPTWRDWRLAANASILYALVIFPLDSAMGANYGFLGRWTHNTGMLADALGPWPWRVPVIVSLIIAVTALPVAGIQLLRQLKKTAASGVGVHVTGYSLPLRTDTFSRAA